LRVLIKSVEIWSAEKRYQSDILISEGIIERIDRGINTAADIVVDGEDCVALPLFVDLHAHLRYPGEEEKEPIENGLRGALKGGFYSVVSMPNTNPPVDSPETIDLVRQKSLQVGASYVLVAAAITEKLEGKRKNSLEELYKAGASAFSDDGKSVTDARIFYEAALEAKRLDVPLLLHEEDYGLSNSSGINDGWASYKTGIKGNSYLSETVLAVRDMIIATEVGARVHIQHVSSKETLRALRHYRTDFITAEVTPHHLLFDETHTINLDTLYKVYPPLRKKEDREALLEALN
jgi:dihydroorotase